MSTTESPTAREPSREWGDAESLVLDVLARSARDDDVVRTLDLWEAQGDHAAVTAAARSLLFMLRRDDRAAPWESTLLAHLRDEDIAAMGDDGKDRPNLTDLGVVCARHRDWTRFAIARRCYHGETPPTQFTLSFETSVLQRLQFVYATDEALQVIRQLVPTRIEVAEAAKVAVRAIRVPCGPLWTYDQLLPMLLTIADPVVHAALERELQVEMEYCAHDPRALEQFGPATRQLELARNRLRITQAPTPEAIFAAP